MKVGPETGGMASVGVLQARDVASFLSVVLQESAVLTVCDPIIGTYIHIQLFRDY